MRSFSVRGFNYGNHKLECLKQRYKYSHALTKKTIYVNN